MELHLAQEPEADRLLSDNPFALLVGMVLDQQVPLEWAFSAPLELRRRLGQSLEPARVAAVDGEVLEKLFSQRPALHRYPSAMANRVQELSRALVEHYGGRAEAVWEGASSGDELLDRVRRLPGFGEQKAKIFVAFLGKQLGVRPPGWEAASAPFSEEGSFRSVADIVDELTLSKVREFKQAMKKSAKATKAAKATGAAKIATARGARAPGPERTKPTR